jgi:hypothetical protein
LPKRRAIMPDLLPLMADTGKHKTCRQEYADAKNPEIATSCSHAIEDYYPNQNAHANQGCIQKAISYRPVDWYYV